MHGRHWDHRLTNWHLSLSSSLNSAHVVWKYTVSRLERGGYSAQDFLPADDKVMLTRVQYLVDNFATAPIHVSVLCPPFPSVFRSLGWKPGCNNKRSKESTKGPSVPPSCLLGPAQCLKSTAPSRSANPCTRQRLLSWEILQQRWDRVETLNIGFESPDSQFLSFLTEKANRV